MSFRIDTDKGIDGVLVGNGKKPAKPKREPHAYLKPPNVLVCLHCGETYAVSMPIEMTLMAALLKAFDKKHRGCKVGVRGVACAHCITFGHKPDACRLVSYGGDWRNWLSGPDTGLSSKTLCYALAGFLDDAKRMGHVPYDSGDFGRCHRLLEAIPGWRARIWVMRDVSPTWSRISFAWDELEKLYLDEKHVALHDRLDELRREP